jgi:hypothetical protein
MQKTRKWSYHLYTSKYSSKFNLIRYLSMNKLSII